jgi:hypothetical protein
MDHPLFGRPVLDEMGFEESQHLDSVRETFHLHDFSNISKQLLEMGKQPSGALSKLLLKSADILELFEHLPDVVPVAKSKNARRRMQMKSSAHDEDYFRRQHDENDDRDLDVAQLNIKFASLK